MLEAFPHPYKRVASAVACLLTGTLSLVSTTAAEPQVSGCSHDGHACHVSSSEQQTGDASTEFWAGSADFAPGTPTDEMLRVMQAAYGGTGTSSSFAPPASRWPGPIGSPTTLTWSFAQDGSVPPPFGQSMSVSTLYSTLNAQFPSQAAWETRFQAMFDRWEELSGIDFERVIVNPDGSDDGASGTQPGQCNLRGDIRIFMRNLDGPFGLLAFANFPSGGGDITFDASEDWLNTPWTNVGGIGFDRTIAHEIGHALGLTHVCPSDDNTKLMQPLAQPNYTALGPWHDDVRGIQSLYGDPLEPNDTLADSSPITSATGVLDETNYGAIDMYLGSNSYGPVGMTSGKLSLRGPEDVDIFRFTASAPSKVDIILAPIGLGYRSYPQDLAGCQGFPGGCCPNPIINVQSQSLVQIHFELLDRNGLVLASQVTGALGGTANIFLADLKFNGTPYYIRVSPTGPNALTFSGPQQYDLTVRFRPGNPCSAGTCDDGDPTNGSESCANDMCYVGPITDCNGNYVEDLHDINVGTSQDLNGNQIPDECESFCAANPNSTGQIGKIDFVGNTFVCNGFIGLTVNDLPPAQFGIFLNSLTTGFVPNAGGSSGNLCLSGAIGRYTAPGELFVTGPTGYALLPLDITMTPTPGSPVSIMAGETWYFQAWHRDVQGGQMTSNYTDAIGILFQ